MARVHSAWSGAATRTAWAVKARAILLVRSLRGITRILLMSQPGVRQAALPVSPGRRPARWPSIGTCGGEGVRDVPPFVRQMVPVSLRAHLLTREFVYRLEQAWLIEPNQNLIKCSFL